MKRILSLVLALAMILSLAACASKSEAARAADEQITAIGEVTLDSGDAIAAAEAAVAALSEDDLKGLEGQQALTDARAAYDMLVAEDEARIAEEQRVAAVKEIEAAISAIGSPVTIDALEAVNTARDLYDKAAADVQSDVSNLAVLEAAEAELAVLKEAAISQLVSTFYADEDKVDKITWYYPSAWKWYDANTWAADKRCFVLPYLGSQNGQTWMRLVYNYAAYDWVFFEKVTIATDANRYTASFSYWDVVRDNGGGRVWEYIDVAVNDSDLEMLRDIANSSEAIIRFEGDDYSYDYTVTDADKTAITETVQLYELMK